MFDTILLLVLIFLLIFCLISTLVYFLYYIGVFCKIEVKVGKPDLHNVWIAYKPYSGPYEQCGAHFTAVSSLGRELDCIAVFYDDPLEVPSHELRYIVGVVLCEGSEKPPQDLLSPLTTHGYHTFQFPIIDYAVKAEFPFLFNLSAVLGAKKVYPVMNAYVKEHKLSAYPFIEYYAKNTIHYLRPLSKQNDFFPPEVEFRIQLSADASPEEGSFETKSDVSTSDEESQGTTSSFEELQPYQDS